MWKEIPGYEGLYSANEFGEVLSHAGKRNGTNNTPTKDKILKPGKTIGGYLFVALRKSNKTKLVLVHRLVAFCFIANPENKATVNHKDGNKSNNMLENLEWMTQKENTIHSYKDLGRKPTKGKIGKENILSKAIIQLDLNNKIIAFYESISDAEKLLNINNISRVCKGKQITCGGYKWKYQHNTENNKINFNNGA